MSEPDEKVWDPGGCAVHESSPNAHVCATICAAIDKANESMDVETDGDESRTELDSHANMVVLGKHSFIIQWTGKHANVSPFTPDYEALRKVPIVDAALLYQCPYTGKEYLLVARNALFVESMENNLIPPFIMREAGIEVNDVPKIQVKDPTLDDHAIIFPGGDFRIPMSLRGIFSYFRTVAPSAEQVRTCEDVYLLTPDGEIWNPHTDAYAVNEERMLDWEGNLVEEQHRQRVLFSDLPEDQSVAAAAVIGAVEHDMIDRNFGVMDDAGSLPDHGPSSDQSGDALLDELSARLADSQFMQSIGATTARPSRYLRDDDLSGKKDIHASPVVDPQSETDTTSVEDLFAQIGEPVSGGIDLEDFMSKAVPLDGFESSAAHARVRRDVTPEHLSKVWRIDLDTAARTIEQTSQHSARVSPESLSRNYRTNDRMLRYKRIREYFFTDTFYATSKAGKSSRGHTCCQLFVTDKGFVFVVPMRKESDFLFALKEFAKAIGAPEALVCDAAQAQKSDKVRQFCHEIGTTLRVLERGTPWANRAELYIGLIKEAVRKDMKESDCPLALWDYCVERRARINNLTARNLFSLHGTTPHTALTHEEGDISNLCQYSWYEWCYFREQSAKFPFHKEVLGRVLGPASGEGNEMAQWVLKSNGKVIPRRSTRPLTAAELDSPSELEKRKLFDKLIQGRYGETMSPSPISTKIEVETVSEDEDEFEPYTDGDEQPRVIPEHEDPVDAAGRVIDQQPAYDKIISSEVLLQNGEQWCTGKVKRRAVDSDGKTTGTYTDNPMLNSIVYEVEFPDGAVKEYAANVIADNMVSQIDSEGFSTTLMHGIVDYRKDESTAIPKSDKWIVSPRGQRRLRKSTAGWKLLVQWKDGSETWVPLKDLKESHPVETAEFAKAKGIDDEVAFAYWEPYTLKKRDAIISAVRSRVRKTTHKYGIELPTSVEHAYEIDRANGNTFWRDAIKKEMYNVGIAFEVLDEGRSVPVGWRKLSYHLVWDVKMDFTRKCRLVLDGHREPTPSGTTFAGVVSRDSVRIVLTYAALNGLDVCAADIRNAYLQAPSSQKNYVICGPEFGVENVGKPALIRRALYGGKTAGKDFRNHLRSCMRHLGFESCLADPDVWFRPAKKADGTEVYDYVLIYTDDVICVSENAEQILRTRIGKYFELKKESIGPPDLYLGGRMSKVVLQNGAEAWAYSSSQYVQAAVKNVESYLSNHGGKLPAKAETPLQSSYRPELDVTPELDATDAAYFQSLIGVLRWIVELGRVDICLEVSLMSSHLALPREGHLAQLFHMFAYLKKYHNTEMVYDPSDPVVEEADFAVQDWTASEFGHVQGKEILPGNAPTPRGMGFIMRAKVDADHASNTVTRRSRTGFIVYLNCAPIYWFSKKQSSVESSSFGSEFTAMKQCCEYLRGLRYKLRMMGIPVDGPAYIYGDNQSVLANTTIPDSTLKKKSQSIAYHFVREGVARGEWMTTYVNTHDNESDLLTKMLPSGEKRRGFVRRLLHHIFRS